MKLWMIAAVGAFLSACASNGLESAGGGSADSENALVDETVARAFEDRPLLPQGEPGDLSIFFPKPQTSGVRLDYATWNDMLRSITFNMGPSTRQRAPSVKAATGTRFVDGHDSPYRLEGNRIFFSLMNEKLISAISEYKDDLIAIGDRYDIAAMNRNEQLAYWINLSNVVTIETIARNYPVKAPSQLRLGDDGARFDEAKIITIRGVALSLNDIRTRIVYPNWTSPEVIYGFFRGDIGGPRIQMSAYSAATAASKLNSNATEFVSSLRGVQDRQGVLYVSKIYDEARPYYFEEWPADLRAHLRKHMRDEFLDDVEFDGRVRFGSYETAIADMAGGDTTGSIAATQVVVDGPNGSPVAGGAFYNSPVGLPPSIRRMYREMERKLEVLQKRGWARGRVVIEDLPTEDPDID